MGRRDDTPALPQPQLPPRLPRLPAPTLLLVLTLLPGAGASPVVGNTTAARGGRTDLPLLPTPSAGCRKPESPCQTALKAQCGHARLQGGNDMCERCAGRQEGPLKKAGCTDKMEMNEIGAEELMQRMLDNGEAGTVRLP